VNHPTREEFDKLKKEQRQLKEEQRQLKESTDQLRQDYAKLQAKLTGPLNITRVEDSGEILGLFIQAGKEDLETIETQLRYRLKS
jgi:predicted nuclease with TOPRIM domain